MSIYILFQDICFLHGFISFMNKSHENISTTNFTFLIKMKLTLFKKKIPIKRQKLTGRDTEIVRDGKKPNNFIETVYHESLANNKKSLPDSSITSTKTLYKNRVTTHRALSGISFSILSR